MQQITVKRWLILTFLLSVGYVTPTLAAEGFGYISRKPQLWQARRPVLEEEPGTNLYWHDPLLGHWETCRAWAPASNGCPPIWYGRAEMLALWRDDPNSIPFATLGPQGPTALSTSNLRSEFDAGMRATVGMYLGDWYRIEGSFFGSYNWDDHAAVRNTDPNADGGVGNLYSPFTNFGDPAGVQGLDFNELVTLRFQSKLHNGEVNLRRRVLMRPGAYETSFLVGARYLEISELFGYHTQSQLPGPLPRTNDVLVDTNNRMIGAQVGLLGQFLIQQRCWVDFEMKGGVYQNRATLSRTFTVSEIGGAVAETFGSDAIDRTTFVGDISLQFNYQFAPAWTFYAGYNAMWVTGVAVAAENFTNSTSLLAVGPTLINHGSSVVYHGPNFGLVFAW